jgi:hypothetical protein
MGENAVYFVNTKRISHPVKFQTISLVLRFQSARIVWIKEKIISHARWSGHETWGLPGALDGKDSNKFVQG